MRKNINQKIVLSELMHLDAPLATAELTNYGESLKNIPWAKEEFPFHPYCVFERRDNVLYFLYDQRGVDWKINHAGEFDENILISKVMEGYDKLESVIKSEKSLSKTELINFFKQIKDYWVWFDAMWWMIEYRDKKGLDVVELMKLRKHTEYFAPGLIATIRNTFKHLVPKYKEYVDVLLIDEVLKEKIPSEEILKQRMKTFAYTDGELFNSIDEVKNKYSVEIKDVKVVSSNELRGQTAYPGKVKGEVKIIKNRDDMKKFQAGNIIVSPTTTPDFLPIMKLCGAIISEHGGVICHASITSRELKIPCVVGVKGATKVLKDGDIVEVDADNGIIKII